MTEIVRRYSRAFIVTAVLFQMTVVAEENQPDVALNSVTGKIEVADTVTVGSAPEIRYTSKPVDGGNAESFLLTSSEDSDRDPKIKARSNGNTWVVWWRDSNPPGVFLKIQDVATGLWSAEKLLSSATESASRPTIADDGTTVWVGFQVGTSSGFELVVHGTQDGADPIPNVTVVGATAYGAPDVQAQASSGRVWLSWVDSNTVVKWSQYDAITDSWSSPEAQSYEGSTAQATRDAIRNALVGS